MTGKFTVTDLRYDFWLYPRYFCFWRMGPEPGRFVVFYFSRKRIGRSLIRFELLQYFLLHLSIKPGAYRRDEFKFFTLHDTHQQGAEQFVRAFVDRITADDQF